MFSNSGFVRLMSPLGEMISIVIPCVATIVDIMGSTNVICGCDLLELSDSSRSCGEMTCGRESRLRAGMMVPVC